MKAKTNKVIINKRNTIPRKKSLTQQIKERQIYEEKAVLILSMIISSNKHTQFLNNRLICCS